ncbi:MAG TPA: hypothetical protein VMR50_18175 [Myxococcota bacterium]|nr:hypothetical protein [Myxococcota bacterium]
MAPVPSIKATVFQTLSDELARWLDDGRVTASDLEERLRPEDHSYLSKQLAASSWVPLDTCERVLGVLVSFRSAGTRSEFLRSEGSRSARDLHRLELYRQFDRSTEDWGPEAGGVLVSLAAVFYNFASWSYQSGHGRGPDRIVVSQAREFPEDFRTATEGFVEYMWRAVLKQSSVVVTSERPTPDQVVFQIERAPS